MEHKTLMSFIPSGFNISLYSRNSLKLMPDTTYHETGQDIRSTCSIANWSQMDDARENGDRGQLVNHLAMFQAFFVDVRVGVSDSGRVPEQVSNRDSDRLAGTVTR